MKLLSVAAVIAFTAGPAFADSKSWSTAKGLLPDNVNVVVGANVTALRATSLYQSIVPTLIAKEPGIQKAIDLAKSSCSIDLHTAIVDATFAMGDDERGVLVLALDKSIDQKRVLECMTKLVTAQMTPKVDVELKSAPSTGGLKGASKKAPPTATDVAKAPAPPPAPKVVAKTTGKVTEYGIDSDAKRLYVAWLAPDVVAIATDPDDKPLLDKMLAGKGTKGTINTFLAKASSSSAVWLATTKPQPVPTGGTMKGGFGTVDTSRGNVSVNMSIVMASAKEAKNFVDQATQMIASSKSALPAQFVKLVDALKLAASGDAANMRLVATEKDVLGLLSLAMMNL